MSDLFPDAAAPQQAPFPWQLESWEKLQANHAAGQLAHAYLLRGESGLGKTRFAQEFARYLLCLEAVEGRACGHCPNCLAGGEDFHPDIQLVGTEEGSREIKVDQVRALAEFLQQTSHSGRAKIVILRDAHALNISAANALLKTLEEPSPRSYLFLVSHMPGTLMPTIRSRCQQIALHKPDWQQCLDWLEQLQPKLKEKKAQQEVRRLWHEFGARPLQILELLEQDYLGQRRDFEQALCQFLEGRQNLLDLVNRGVKQGEGLVLGYLQHLSAILIKYQATADLPADVSDEIRKLATALVPAESVDRQAMLPLLEFEQNVSRAIRQLTAGNNPNPRLTLEAMLHQWSQLPKAAVSRA